METTPLVAGSTCGRSSRVRGCLGSWSPRSRLKFVLAPIRFSRIEPLWAIAVELHRVIELHGVIELLGVIELVQITLCGSARASVPLRAGGVPGRGVGVLEAMARSAVGAGGRRGGVGVGVGVGVAR